MEYRIGAAVLNGWCIEKRLGGGGFGTVYLISKSVAGVVSRSALKVISVLPPNDPGLAMLPPERLISEYALMQQLKGCPYVVRCEDICQIDHTDDEGYDILIRMELLTPLPKYKKEHPLDAAEAARLGMEICQALSVCHRQHIMHRDVKPDNILVDTQANNIFKLSDFGISKVMEHSMASTGVFTPQYAAPEVLSSLTTGVKYGPTVDVYSLGIVLYQLLNHGRYPLTPTYPSGLTVEDEPAARARRCYGDPLPPPDQAPPALAAVILKACAYQPQERYQSAAEMKAALQAAMTGPSAEEKRERREREEAARQKREEAVRKAREEREQREREEAARRERERQERENREKVAAEQRRQEEAARQRAEWERQAQTQPENVIIPGGFRPVQPVKKKKKGWLVAVACVACLAVALMVAIPAIQKAESYRQAAAVYALGNYSRAVELYQALGDYKDSAELLTQAEAEAEAQAQAQAEVLANAKVGDTVVFGSYEQDNNTGNGKEPIEWKVLDKQDGQLLLISKYILDCWQYNSEYTNVTWATCDLRAWLNDEFLSVAFTESEQGKIEKTTVTNEDNPSYGTDGGANTQDKVFLLSIAEAEEYFDSDDARRAKPTVYAEAQGVWTNSNGYCWW